MLRTRSGYPYFLDQLIEALGFLVDMANFNRQQVPVGSQPDFRRRFAGCTKMQRPQEADRGFQQLLADQFKSVAPEFLDRGDRHLAGFRQPAKLEIEREQILGTCRQRRAGARTEARDAARPVEFDAVNTGKRMELCIRMATLRSTKCPIIIVDDAVNIDDANWEAFVAAARQSNLQIVAARLDSGDLRIEAYDSLEVAA